jgi:hypothetical protein
MILKTATLDNHHPSQYIKRFKLALLSQNAISMPPVF